MMSIHREHNPRIFSLGELREETDLMPGDFVVMDGKDLCTGFQFTEDVVEEEEKNRKCSNFYCRNTSEKCIYNRNVPKWHVCLCEFHNEKKNNRMMFMGRKVIIALVMKVGSSLTLVPVGFHTSNTLEAILKDMCEANNKKALSVRHSSPKSMSVKHSSPKSMSVKHSSPKSASRLLDEMLE